MHPLTVLDCDMTDRHCDCDCVLTQGDSVNAAILHAIFGDGCAVAVVGGLTASTAKPGSLAVLDNQSWLVSIG